MKGMIGDVLHDTFDQCRLPHLISARKKRENRILEVVPRLPQELAAVRRQRGPQQEHANGARPLPRSAAAASVSFLVDTL